MRSIALAKATKAILSILIVGIALVILTGCGVGHGTYRNGFYGSSHNGEGYDYSDSYPNERGYHPNGGSYVRHPSGDRGHQGGYCRW